MACSPAPSQVLPAMVAQASGHVVVVSSVQGLIGLPYVNCTTWNVGIFCCTRPLPSAHPRLLLRKITPCSVHISRCLHYIFCRADRCCHASVQFVRIDGGGFSCLLYQLKALFLSTKRARNQVNTKRDAEPSQHEMRRGMLEI
jgi:hypothetical protein